MSVIRVSVLVAAYNEQSTIVQILESVRAQVIEGIAFEVIVVNDGSRDGTLALLQSRPELYDILVDRPRNGGKGAAVISGLEAATGDYVLFQDADLEYSPTDYAKLMFPVLQFRADVVMGSRFRGDTYSRVHFFWHMVGNKVVTFTFNLFFNTTFTDIYTCYLLYRRDLFNPQNLVTRGWEQHAEILCQCVKKGKLFYEVPISYNGRSYEDGKKIRPHHVLGVFKTMLIQRFTAR
jgi:glycosyltransferase involved in cell wall biosynthesis